MHFFCITRGIKHEVDRFITELQGKYLPFEYEPGKKGLVQLSIRPVQLWEFVFPEPELQTVLKTFEPLKYARKIDDKSLWILRKALQADKIPDLDPNHKMNMPTYIPFPDGIEMIGIGVRKDKYHTEGQFKGCEKL